MDLGDCRALLGHTEWADALVWKAVADGGAGDDQLRSTLHHLHMVQWAYLHVWRGEALKPREPSSFPTVLSVRGWAREYYRELASYLAGVTSAAAAEPLRFPWADRLVHRFGGAEPASWAESVLQVAMHSAHHRGQALQRLRALGAEPPLCDFIVWVWTGRPDADWGEEEAA